MERSQISAHVSGTNADATKYAMNPHDSARRIRSAYMLAHATTAANASNYQAFNIKVGGSTVGTLSTASVALTAASPRAFTLSGDTTLNAGDVVTLEAVKSGTGPTYSADFVLELEPVR